MFRVKSLWVTALLCACCLISGATPALAEDSGSDVREELREMRSALEEMRKTVQQQNETIQRQQERIGDLEKRLIAPATPVPGYVSSSAALPPAGRPTGGLGAFLPDIGAVADIFAQLSESKEDGEGNDRIALRELELVLGHDIDPYSRFDSTITFSDFEDVSVEEAYITHSGLPWNVRGKIGRLRPKVGKASAVHRDALETVEDPLVVQRYLGAEGLSRTGLELSKILPAFLEPLTQEITAGVMEGGVGEGGTLFGGTRRRPSFYAHLKNFLDLSDTTNLEMGGTYLTGSSDEDPGFEVNALGLDATLIHHFNPVNRLKWQSEAYLQDRENFATSVSSDTTGEEVRTDLGRHPLGLYSLMEYRINPRWGIGGRADYVQPVNAPVTNPRSAETGLSAFLTFFQSEFARWRLQYSHVEKAEGGNDDRFMLQGTVAIGVHKHQLQ